MSKYDSEPDFGRYPDADVIYDGDEVPSFALPESPASLMPGATYLYMKGARSALAEYTGSEEVYLTAEDEFKLATAIQAGIVAQETIELAGKHGVEYDAALNDMVAQAQQARQKMIVCNLRFAASIARRSMNIGPAMKGSNEYKGPHDQYDGTYGDLTKLRSPHASLDDRIQAANEALIYAVDKFAPTISPKTGKAVRFTTFALWVIQGRLARDIAYNETNGVHTPLDVLAAIQQSKKTPEDFTPGKLASLRMAEIHLDRQSYEAIRADYRDNELREDWSTTDHLQLSDVMSNEDAPMLEDSVIVRELTEQIAKLLDTFSEREAGVIIMRFGLFGTTPKTLDEIGDTFNVTRERIRQIESKAMARLRHPSYSDSLRDFIDDDGLVYANRGNLLQRYHGIGHVALSPTDEPLIRDATAAFDDGAFTRLPDGWQYNESENWDDPVRRPLPELLDDEKVMTLMAGLITPELFIETATTNPEYNQDRLAEIVATLGPSLRPYHIEEYWNEQLPVLLEMMHTHKQEIGYEKVSLFFSRLLVEKMEDEDSVSLFVPNKLNGKLDWFGYGLVHGRVEVNGNLGDHAGERIGSLATLVVNGSVGDYAGAYASGFANLFVSGNAGRQFAFKAHGENDIRCEGQVVSVLPDITFNGDIHVKQLHRPSPGVVQKVGNVHIG